MFQNKVVVLTGGASGIGKAIHDFFLKEKAHVCTIDVLKNDYFQGDIADEKTLDLFVKKVIKDYGKVDYFIHNACVGRGGLFDCSVEDFDYVYRVCLRASLVAISASSLPIRVDTSLNSKSKISSGIPCSSTWVLIRSLK